MPPRNPLTASRLTRRAKAASCPADARVALLAAAEWARRIALIEGSTRRGMRALLPNAEARLAQHLALAEQAFAAAKVSA